MKILICIFLMISAVGSLAQQALLPAPAQETRVTASEARRFKIFRGEFIRTEILRVEVMDLYDCRLARNTLPEIGILVGRKQHQIFHEVKVYQAVQMQVKEQENMPSLPEYHPLKNRVLYGEETTRDNIQDMGVWKNENFFVNGHKMKTDSRGLITDRQQNLFGVWRFFDQLDNRRFNLKISHWKMGDQILEVYRIIPRRKKYDERNLDEDVQNDILWANDIDFTQMHTDPERKALQVTAEYEDSIQPGAFLEITLTVQNSGKASTSCLLGRIFSSEKWLNGYLFYFGMVSPGQKRSFKRFVKIPEKISAGRVFADVAFCDSWNPLLGLRQKMSLTQKSQGKESPSVRQ